MALSTLHSHLTSLGEHRELSLEGSTMRVADYFSTVSRVLGHPVTVEYITRESLNANEEEQRVLGNEYVNDFTTVRRLVGFGGCVIKNPVNGSYSEFKVKSWEGSVKLSLGM